MKWLNFGSDPDHYMDLLSDLDHCLDHPDPGYQMCLCTI